VCDVMRGRSVLCCVVRFRAVMRTRAVSSVVALRREVTCRCARSGVMMSGQMRWLAALHGVVQNRTVSCGFVRAASCGVVWCFALSCVVVWGCTVTSLCPEETGCVVHLLRSIIRSSATSCGVVLGHAIQPEI